MNKTKVVLFGIGNNGKSIMDAYGVYDTYFEVVAIADNCSEMNSYAGVDVITPDQISSYEYDEIWIASIHYKEIRKQLVEHLNISLSVIRYVEYPMPFLEKKILDRYKEELAGDKKCESDELQDVIDYIADNGVRMYCYPFYDEYMDKYIPVYYDDEYKLYYGICFGHKMYLSRKYDTQRKAELYLQFVCMEQDSRSPHCYFSEYFNISDGDVGIDVGAAEGIFAIRVIDKVEHIYLIEADTDWCDALEATFFNEKDKVTIIQGYVSDTDKNGSISIDAFFQDRMINFIKMDIEGAERKALQGARQLIERCVPKMAVCTYHNASDEKEISDWLKTICPYKVINSRGYVVCQGEWELECLENVGLRRALVWAERK